MKRNVNLSLYETVTTIMSESKANRKVHNLIGLMQKNLECSICLDLLKNPVSTKCDHPFCNFCITEFLRTNRSVPCPLCKTPVTKRSLRERPQLSKIVEDVRQLVEAFQKDTGDMFSPSLCPQSMQFSLGSPDQLPTKEQRGTKRKSSSLERKNVRNVRQSKRRKSDICEAGDAMSESQTETDSGTVNGDGDVSTINRGTVNGNSDPSNLNRQKENPQGQELNINYEAEKQVSQKIMKRNKKQSTTTELLNYLEHGSCGANNVCKPPPKGHVLEKRKLPEVSPRKADNLFERLSGLSEDNFREEYDLGIGLEEKKVDREIGEDIRQSDKGNDKELFSTPEEISTIQKTYSRKCKNGKEVMMKTKVKQWLKNANVTEGEENSKHETKGVVSVERKEVFDSKESKEEEAEVYSGDDFMEIEGDKEIDSDEKDVVESSIHNGEIRNFTTIDKGPKQTETCTGVKEGSTHVNESRISNEGQTEKKKTDVSSTQHKIFKSTRSDYHVSAECSVTQSKGKLLFKKIKPKKVIDITDTKSDHSEAKVAIDSKIVSAVNSDKQRLKVRNIFDLDLNSSGQDSDPYEFKSSQKTPVKNTTKKGKARKIQKTGQICVEVKKPTEKHSAASFLKKVKRKDDKVRNGADSEVIEILEEAEEKGDTRSSKHRGSTCNLQKDKKVSVNFKLTQKDFDDMEQLKDKISEAEDYDLITNTQEVQESMDTASTCQGEELSTSEMKLGRSGNNGSKTGRKKLVSFHEEVILIGEDNDTVPLNNKDTVTWLGTKEIQGKKGNSSKIDVESYQGNTEQKERNIDSAVIQENHMVSALDTAPEDLVDDLPCSGTSSATDDLDIAPDVEDFEEPDLDIQPKEVIEKLNSQESEDPIPRSHDGHVSTPTEGVSQNIRKAIESRNTELDSLIAQDQSFQTKKSPHSVKKKSPNSVKKLSLSKPMIGESLVADSDIVPETPVISNYLNNRSMIKMAQMTKTEKANKIHKELEANRSEDQLKVAEIIENTPMVVCHGDLVVHKEEVVTDSCETQVNGSSTGNASVEVDSECVIKSSREMSLSRERTCTFKRTKLKSDSRLKNASIQKTKQENGVEKAFEETDLEPIIESSVKEPQDISNEGKISSHISDSVNNCSQISTQNSVSLLQPQKMFSPSLDSATSSLTDVSDNMLVEPSEEPVLKKPKRKCFSLSKSPKQAKNKKENFSSISKKEKRGFDEEVICLSAESVSDDVRESESMPTTKRQNKLKRLKNKKELSAGSSYSRDENRTNNGEELTRSSSSNCVEAVILSDDGQTGHKVIVTETVDAADVQIDDNRCVSGDMSDEEVNAVPETLENEVVMNSDKQGLSDTDICMEHNTEKVNRRGEKENQDEMDDITQIDQNSNEMQKEEREEKAQEVGSEQCKTSQDELTSTLLSNRTVRRLEKLEKSRQDSPDDIFMMDSEYPDGCTESEFTVEQNQEGMLDLLTIDYESEHATQVSQKSVKDLPINSEGGEDNAPGSQLKEKELPNKSTKGDDVKLGKNLMETDADDTMQSVEKNIDSSRTCNDIVQLSVSNENIATITNQKTPVKQKAGGRKIKRGLATKFFKELNLSQSTNVETVSEEEDTPVVQRPKSRDASPTFDSSPYKGSQNDPKRLSSQDHERQMKPVETFDLSEHGSDDNEQDHKDVEEDEEKGDDNMDFEEKSNPTIYTEVDIVPDSVQEEIEEDHAPKKFIAAAQHVSPKVSLVSKKDFCNSSLKKVINIEKECSQQYTICTEVKSSEVKCPKTRKRKANTKQNKSQSRIGTTLESPSSSPLPVVLGTSGYNSQAERCDVSDDEDDDIEDEDDPVLIKRNTSDMNNIHHLDNDSDSTQMPQPSPGKLTCRESMEDRQKGEISDKGGDDDDLSDDSKDDKSESDSSDFVLLSGKEENNGRDLQNRNVTDDEDDIVPSKRIKGGKRIVDDSDNDGDSVIDMDTANRNVIENKDDRVDDNDDVIIDDVKHQNCGNDIDLVESRRPENVDERPFNIGDMEDDDEDESDDDIVAVRKRKSQVIDDSESDVTNCSQETSSDRQGNLTLSSAFSSQSDVLSTEDQAKLAENLEHMRREIARMEANLAAARRQSLNLSHGTSGSKNSRVKNKADLSREAIDQVEICTETPVKENKTVVEEEEEKIRDYDSDSDSSEDLFLSPPPPTPPPSDGEQQEPVELDLPESVKEADRFLQQFRSDKKTPSKPVTCDPIRSSAPSFVYHSTPKNGRIISPFSSRNKATVISPLTQGHKRSPLEFVSSQRRSGTSGLSENNQRFPSPLLTKKGLSQDVTERIPLSPLAINSSQSQFTKERQPHRVFAATSLHLSQMREMQKLLQEHGCQFNPKFNRDVTHLIVKTDPQGSRVCERTLKFFQAVSMGSWVLDYQYILDCKSIGRILPEERYEILGDTVTGDCHFGPRKSRQSKERDLFQDFSFIIIGDSRGLNQDDLQSLISECGGSVVSHPDQISSDHQGLVVTCTDIDGDDEDTETRSSQEFKVINRLYRLHHMITVSREWVLDSLTLYQVQPIEDYVLTDVKGMILPKL